MNVTLPSGFRNFNDNCTLSLPTRNEKSQFNKMKNNSVNFVIESFEGSGAIQQGNGDNDENLQS